MRQWRWRWLVVILLGVLLWAAILSPVFGYLAYAPILLVVALIVIVFIAGDGL